MKVCDLGHLALRWVEKYNYILFISALKYAGMAARYNYSYKAAQVYIEGL